MDQVIEHVTNPLDILTGINSILKPNGICILSTPNSNGWGAKIFGKKWINWHAPYHLHHFSKQSIEILSKRAGFEIESIKPLQVRSGCIINGFIFLLFQKKVISLFSGIIREHQSHSNINLSLN